MIFVTVGTQLPFDRLVRGMDAWAQAHPATRVQAQIGNVPGDGYHPRHMPSAPTLAPAEFDTLCRDADLIVAHAGTGSLLAAQAHATPIITMPRRGALGEHRNDHQSATAAHFGRHDGIFVVHDEAGIGPMVDRVLLEKPPGPGLPGTADEALVSAIRDVIFSGDVA